MNYTSLAIWMFTNTDVDNEIFFYVLNYIFDGFTDAFKQNIVLHAKSILIH